MSDLHMDFSKFEIPSMPDDSETVLILAGDVAEIAHKSSYIDFFNEVCDQFKMVVYVFGNHEFYSDSIYRAHEHFARVVQRDNLYVLDDQKIELGNIVILGSTLWTDIDKGNPALVYESKNYMSDYTVIRGGSPLMPYQRPLRPEDTIKRNMHSKNWLFSEITKAEAEGKFVIVVSHHAPTWESVSEEYKNDRMTHNFTNDYSEALLDNEGPNLWIHGHLHRAIDYKMGKTIVMANPRGYHSKQHNEYTGFDENLVIEVNEENGDVSIIKKAETDSADL